jgi:tetratricopeptide (TPR) repeat protein
VPCSCSQQLGGVLQEAGKLEDALLHFESAVSLNFKVFGGVHKRTLMSMNDLASLFYEMGRLEKALPLYVTANRELLGVRHGDYLAVLFNLAQLLMDQGELLKAEHLFAEACQTAEEVLGPDHPSTLMYKASFKEVKKLQLKKGKI